jgi:hypothetical protein
VLSAAEITLRSERKPTAVSSVALAPAPLLPVFRFDRFSSTLDRVEGRAPTHGRLVPPNGCVIDGSHQWVSEADPHKQWAALPENQARLVVAVEEKKGPHQKQCTLPADHVVLSGASVALQWSRLAEKKPINTFAVAMKIQVQLSQVIAACQQ